MKYLFTLLLLISAQLVHAQAGSLLGHGIQAAISVGSMVIRNSKDKARQQGPMPHVAATTAAAAAAAATAATAAAAVPNVAPVPPASNHEFAYQGQRVARQRTEATELKGKGATELLALEAVLEQTHQMLLADSQQPFLPAAQLEAIRTAARQAAAARSGWNFAPYQHEVGFYQYEEARRTARTSAPPATPESGK